MKNIINYILKFIYKIKYLIIIFCSILYVHSSTIRPDYSWLSNAWYSIYAEYESDTKTHYSSFLLNKKFNQVSNIKPYNFRFFGSEAYIEIKDASEVFVSALASDCSLRFVDNIEMKLTFIDENLQTIKSEETIFDMQKEFPYTSYSTSSENVSSLSDCVCLENTNIYENVNYYDTPYTYEPDVINFSKSDYANKTGEILVNRNDVLDSIAQLSFIVEKTPYISVELNIKMLDGSSYNDFRVFDTRSVVKKSN